MWVVGYSLWKWSTTCRFSFGTVLRMDVVSSIVVWFVKVGCVVRLVGRDCFVSLQLPFGDWFKENAE